jgi:Xaa-Pro aminopeptidase
MNKPFQNFDDVSDAARCAPRLAALRAELAKRGLDGFLVPRADEHQGEYVPPRAERLAWLTAFTGSAGLAAVLQDKAALFVDGRYTLQAQQQTDTTLFETLDLTPEISAGWIAANLKKDGKLGYDPWLHTQAAVERWRGAVARAGGTLVPCTDNPLDAVWSDQPGTPAGLAAPYPDTLAGETSDKKRARVAESLKQAQANAAVLTQPDSICWLLNIRGSDVAHTPFVLAFAILHADGTLDLFLDERKRTPELIAHLGAGVRLHAPDMFAARLDALSGKSVIADPMWSAAFIFDRLGKAGAKIQRVSDPCQLPKACKNAAEIAGMKRAHIRDGAALARFLAWFAREAPKGGLTEMAAAEKLESFRAATGALKDLSFDTISGAGPNGAVVHYRVTRKTNRAIAPGELYLIDSGAQYEDGTTDVTRTVAVGKPSDEMRDRFTRVLKGHIRLALARFPEGTTGGALDILARHSLWEAGLDYEHGTGHGVGHYLSVHEGPQSISKRGFAQALRPGMICSNEPGYYKTSAYGIRIENLVVVSDPLPIADGEKPMMGFETITLAPIDLAVVETALLTHEERDWLNAYHARVRETLSELLMDDREAHAWLVQATQAI